MNKILLTINKIKCALQKRNKTLKKKSYASWAAKGYNNAPLVSFIIESHNKSLQVMHIVEKLRSYPNAEIIVIDDGSGLEHTERLAKGLINANEFIIRSNDLYENVMYDKAIRFANGKYLVLLQDDDDFENLLWVKRAVYYFNNHPNMVILGGRDGLNINLDKNREAIDGDNDIDQDMDFMFVHHINRAPMWIRKSLFIEKLYHIDFNFAPFLFDDIELCLRAWLCGLQVGWYKTEFSSLSAGGMRIWNNSFTSEQSQRNAPKLYKLYADKKDELDSLVAEARRQM